MQFILPLEGRRNWTRGKCVMGMSPVPGRGGQCTLNMSRLKCTTVCVGLGSNPGEDMDACKCIVPLRHEDTLNSRRAASPLVRLVEREERWEAPDHPQGILHINWGGSEPNRTVTCMVLKATVNDRRHLVLFLDECYGP
ncbi:uncharacterized protein TNCV_4951461 [Trichonephila clavipes]|nr:uncharacterized protein TNCV_4951461 [Trichonephila clavipes]